MRWIREHKILSAAIGILAAAVIIFSVSMSGSGSGGITGMVGNLYSYVEKHMTAAGRAISENVSGIFSYRELMKENEELRDEIDELKEEMNRMSLNEEELEDLRELSAALNYDFIGSSDDIVTATIISFDGLNWTNIFTINRGSDSGIEEGDVVICGDGLVGRVSQTGRNWAKVMSLIDESVKISFKSEDDTDMLGIIEGTSDGELSGYMLEEKSKIKEGSRLVTSGVGMYPDGIDIGRVSEVWYDSDTQLTRIKVTPSVDFMALDKVSVVL
jgi:rod shape-determining protein MreC